MFDFLNAFLIKFAAGTAATPLSCANDQHSKFLGLIPKWYEYLPYGLDSVGNCAVKLNIQTIGANGVTTSVDFSQFLLIGLAILDMILHVAGVVAIGFVIYGGIQYVLSQGEPDKVSSAKNTITNALIGLVIVFIAVPLVAFIGKSLGG